MLVGDYSDALQDNGFGRCPTWESSGRRSNSCQPDARAGLQVTNGRGVAQRVHTNPVYLRRPRGRPDRSVHSARAAKFDQPRSRDVQQFCPFIARLAIDGHAPPVSASSSQG